jgi:hypothetical protein
MSDQNERTMAKARQHTTVIAASLRHVIGPIPAAGLLLGGACGILLTEFGREHTVRHLRELADSVENDDGDDDQAPTTSVVN